MNKGLILVDIYNISKQETTYDELMKYTGLSLQTLRGYKADKKLIKSIGCIIFDGTDTYRHIKRAITDIGDLDGEVWKTLACGYKISNMGRYRDLKGIVAIPMREKSCHRIRKMTKGVSLTLYTANEVYKAFIGDIPQDCTVYHKDGNTLNCKAENLVLDRKNMNHKYYKRACNRIAVVAVDIDTGEETDYASITEAGKSLFMDISSVHNSLREQRPVCGYRFYKLDEYERMNGYEIHSNV